MAISVLIMPSSEAGKQSFVTPLELTLGSETSTQFNQTPGLYPKENTLQSFVSYP
jgi:hypothetical protein